MITFNGNDENTVIFALSDGSEIEVKVMELDRSRAQVIIQSENEIEIATDARHHPCPRDRIS